MALHLRIFIFFSNLQLQNFEAELHIIFTAQENNSFGISGSRAFKPEFEKKIPQNKKFKNICPKPTCE